MKPGEEGAPFYLESYVPWTGYLYLDGWLMPAGGSVGFCARTFHRKHPTAILPDEWPGYKPDTHREANP